MVTETVDTTSTAVRDVLVQLWMHGPTWDGNIASKSGRDGLCNLGLVQHEKGFAWLTRAGVHYCIDVLALDRQKS